MKNNLNPILLEWYNEENETLNDVDKGINAGRALYHGIKLDREINPGKSFKRRLAIAAAMTTATGISHLIAKVGYKIRDKRQQEIFFKITDKFPKPSDMIKFLESIGKPPSSILRKDMPLEEYYEWIKKHIVHQGEGLKLFAKYGILSGIFGGLGVTGYNFLAHKIEGLDTPETTIANRLR